MQGRSTERPYMSHYMRYAISYGRFTKRPYMLDAHGASLLARTSAAIFTIALCFFLFFGFHRCHRSIYPVGECRLIRAQHTFVKKFFQKNAPYRKGVLPSLKNARVTKCHPSPQNAIFSLTAAAHSLRLLRTAAVHTKLKYF